MQSSDYHHYSERAFVAADCRRRPVKGRSVTPVISQRKPQLAFLLLLFLLLKCMWAGRKTHLRQKRIKKQGGRECYQSVLNRTHAFVSSLEVQLRHRALKKVHPEKQPIFITYHAISFKELHKYTHTNIHTYTHIFFEGYWLKIILGLQFLIQSAKAFLRNMSFSKKLKHADNLRASEWCSAPCPGGCVEWD